jgi:replicative DNA helicase
MRRNILSQDDFRSLAMSCGKLSQAPIFIDDSPGLTVLMLRAKARRMVAQHGVRCLFVDYLQLMSAPSAAKESRQAEVSTISRGIKALARELNIPIIALAQLNRAAEQREGNRPRMADLRESGSLEQDADVVMLLHREEYYHLQSPTWAEENPDKVGIAEIIIAKQRNGPTGAVELRWNASTTRFQNLAKGYQPHVVTRPAEPTRTATVRSESRRGEERVDPHAASVSNEASAGAATGRERPAPADFRDGGGPEREPPPWSDDEIEGLPI